MTSIRIKRGNLLARMIEKAKGTKWFMAGTENTGQYVVVARSKLGRVGFRVTGSYVRVRIEPTEQNAPGPLATEFNALNGWKLPRIGGQWRFSKVFNDPEEAIAAIELAIKALERGGKVERQPGTRSWRLALRRARLQFTQPPAPDPIPAT